ITFFSGELLPGFLQMEDYTRVLLEWGGKLPDSDIKIRIAARTARRRTMTRTDPPPPSCWCILGEAGLRANVGGPEVMAAQLEHVLDWSAEQPNAAVQVLPLGSGAHWLMGLTQTLLKFDPPAGDILHGDSLARNVFSDGPN